MNLKLVKLTKEYENQLKSMLDEWTKNKSKDSYDLTPWALFKNDYNDFENYINNLEVKDETDGLVLDSTFFCLDLSRNIFVGAVNIRHYLNDYLLKYGGHIGDGIRPSERGKGYGTKMIALALEECTKLKIKRVLMTCNKKNIASRKTIISNGGILDSEVELDGEIIQRFWIEL